MCSRTFVLAGCLIGVAAFSGGLAAGRTVESGPALRSVHLLNLPSTVSEADLAGAIRKVNAAIAQAGHPTAGYRLWKATDVESAEYDYFWVGVWSSQDAYDVIHKDEKWQATVEAEMAEMYEALRPHQVYSRYAEIPVGGPGSR